jgi:hypothetical protein
MTARIAPGTRLGGPGQSGFEFADSGTVTLGIPGTDPVLIARRT